MEPDYRALPLTRRQLDTWLSPETGHSGTQCAVSLFASIDGSIERDAIEYAIRPGWQAAESSRASFFDAYDQNFQRATNSTDVEQASATCHLTLYRPIGIGVITTSHTQHSDIAGNGRRRVGLISRSQQAIRINRCLRNHRMRRG